MTDPRNNNPGDPPSVIAASTEPSLKGTRVAVVKQEPRVQVLLRNDKDD